MTTPHAHTFWAPDPETTARSRIADFGRWAARHRGVEADLSDYSALHRWSVTDLEGCWGAVWESP